MTPPPSGPANAAGTQRSGRDTAGAGSGVLGARPAVQSLDDCVEEIEDRLFDDIPHSMEVQRRSFQLRKSLVLLRRVVLPMREVVNAVMRRDKAGFATSLTAIVLAALVLYIVFKRKDWL